MSKTFDVVIIGAGVLGCFTARNLMRYYLKVAILERNPDVCMEISRANTSIVYPGYDTKPGTLKTELTIKANRNFDTICEELDVEFVRCGSLMVAYGERSMNVLHEKLQQGIENGVRGLKILSREETLEMEPNLSPEIVGSLYSPDTGTVNPWELGIAAAENAVDNGAELFLEHEVTGIKKENGLFKVTAGDEVFEAKVVVNCAGRSTHKISELIAAPYFRIVPTRGEYLVLDTKSEPVVSHVIFQEAEKKIKGVDIVPTTDGKILIGASESELRGEENFATTNEGLEFLHRRARAVLPSIPLSNVIRSFGTLRPNPFHAEVNPETGKVVISDRSIHNFMIGEPVDVPGLINLVGIKTPGLTCSNEIGRYTAELVVSRIGDVKRNTGFNPYVKKRIRFSRLSPGEQKALAEKNRAYGRIVCRCGKITEGEVLDAINMKVGAKTVDGVKRRAGTCLGRCQGSFCTERIMEILSRELGISTESIRKDKRNSWIVES